MQNRSGKILKPIKNDGQNNSSEKALDLNVPTSQVQKPSMSSLILWNVKKAFEKNPDIDLKSGIKAAQDRLECDTCGRNITVIQCPEQQHFLYAFLAWQQLGHANSDSLYKFIQAKAKENLNISETCNLIDKNPSTSLVLKPSSIKLHCSKHGIPTEDVETEDFGAYSKGPVIKLPVDTKIVMRCETHQNNTSTAATSSKIEAACCMESVCSERLSAMDAATSELRARVAKLANREAQRVILLERAEAAWGDLERGYQKRLTLAEEKEDDLERQIKKLIEDRNNNKKACTELANQLKEAGDAAMKEQTTVKEVEKTLCGCACTRLKLNEEVARAESAVTDLQCKVVQLDRDLQFKEEQARRKLLTIDSETESARVLTHEAERALRAELGGLRQQIEEVSKQLLEEDEINKRIKAELEQLREEKKGMIEDLDGCKVMCDSKMQSRLNDMKKKREELHKLKEKVIDCQCKVPVDATVTVKRTPSLAALCKCAPEDRFLESCSCTSLRGSLLSTLLADLFSGLQSELGGDGLQMPCQLLKCLEDKHNWDRSSVVKSNLRNFFSKLLVGELDIAIATSIEKYHAKWVGASCADDAQMVPDPKDDLKKGWEQRALEKRAQTLATKLAEQLFEERAEELSKRAKQIVTSGPPPCECNKTQKRSENTSVLSCLTDMKTPFEAEKLNQKQSFNPLEVTQKEVTGLRLQIEDLKKETIKKADLKLIEEKIAKLANQYPESENECFESQCTENTQMDMNKKQTKFIRHINIHESPKCPNSCKTICGRRKMCETNSAKKCYANDKPTKQPKKYNHNQSFAVNLCMCEPLKVNKTSDCTPIKTDITPSLKTSKEMIHQTSGIKQNTPINLNLTQTCPKNRKEHLSKSRDKKFKCLHEMPSTTSIDRLFATLTKTEDNCASIFKKTDKYDSTISLIKPKHENSANECKHGNKIEVPRKSNPRFNNNRAVNTASVYMTTVNLDKSSDFASKSINTIDINEIKENDVNNDETISGDTNQFQRSSNLVSGSNKHLRKVKVLNEHLYGNIKNTEYFNVLMNSNTKSNAVENPKRMESKLEEISLMSNKTYQTVNENSMQTEILQKETKPTDLIISKTNTIDISVPNFDYYIKFLGVTLTNTCSQEQANNCKCNKIPQRMKQNSHKQNDCELKTTLDNIKNNISDTERNKQINNNLRNSNWMENIQEQCVCCNKDSAKNLEENAFHLLEDHLKQKLRQLKTCSCEASCLLPEDEEKIFNSILQKVRQVISNYANKIKCSEPEGSWKRAYGLLKEYLKIKIKRIQGVPLTNKKSYEVLPDILDKVCNLIENDFQRLKDVCKCNKQDKCLNINKKSLIKSGTEDLPERDTSISKKQYSNDIIPMCGEKLLRPNLVNNNIQNMSCQVYPHLWMTTKSCEALSETKCDNRYLVNEQANQNTFKPSILKLTTSVQVTPDLGMETKSCDIMEMTHDVAIASESHNDLSVIPKTERTTSTNYVIAKKVPQSQINDYYHYPNNLNSDILQICRNKELLLNLYADVLVNCDITGASKEAMKQDFNIGFVNSLPNLNQLQLFKTVTTTKKQKQDSSDTPVIKPYFGYTVHCTCDENVSTCMCIKSMIQSNNYNISNEWPQFIASKNNVNSWTYIMNSSKNVRRNNELLTSANHFKETTNIIDVNTNKPQPDRKYEGNVVSIVPMLPIFDTHDNNNAQKAVTFLDTNSNNEGILSTFDETKSIPNDFESVAKKSHSQKSNEELKKTSEYVTTLDMETLTQKCNCNKVPICHVRMLIENIERSLMASKCTCDSFSRFCPLHFRKNA